MEIISVHEANNTNNSPQYDTDVSTNVDKYIAITHSISEYMNKVKYMQRNYYPKRFYIFKRRARETFSLPRLLP